MRLVLVLAAGAAAALAGCATEADRVSATPPTVSYRVSGTDIAQANVSAAQYCQRYGTAPFYQGLQSTASGNVAIYSCDGRSAVSGSSVPPAAAQQYQGPVLGPGEPCADFIHEDRPGGSDYAGPPVPTCPPAH